VVIKQTFICNFDDLECGLPGFEEILKLKEHYPKLKVTLFMTPIPEIFLKKQITEEKYKEWAQELKKDWIEICPHGLTHQGQEMMFRTNNRGKVVLLDYDTAKLYIEVAEKTFKDLDLPYKKIWKSPHWSTSPEAYKALWKKGYKVACDPNQPHPPDTYLYDWSIDRRIPLRPIVKGHGHLSGNNENHIRRCIKNLLQIPVDAEFLFVSEAIERGL